MKSDFLLRTHIEQRFSSVFATALLAFWPLEAATINVAGIIEGRGAGPVGTIGETMDYLKFEVLSTSTVQIVGTNLSARRLLHLAEYIGRDDTFSFIGTPYQLRDNYPSPTPPVLERVIDPGFYVVVVDDDEDSEYDWGDGFVPVNTDGGFFSYGEYSFEVHGDVRGLELWEGLLDPQPFGSFKITNIPEPTVVVLLAASSLFGLRRRYL